MREKFSFDKLKSVPIFVRERCCDNLPYEQVGKNEPVCIADEVPFEIPESWEWVRLSTICSSISDGTHKTPKYLPLGIPFVSVKDISSGTLEFTNTKFISIEEHQQLIKRCKPEIDDILICRIGTLGKAIRIDTDDEFSIFVSLGLIKLLESEIADYVVQVINSGYGYSWIQRVKVGGGTHTFKINLEDLRSFLIPLPPIDEQRRIKEKLRIINPFVDAYCECNDRNQALITSFPERLKKSILQQAVMGKLVPQDPADEPASVLLERIRNEKEQLIRAGKIKRDKHESVIFRRDNSHYEKFDGIERCIDDEIPFELPENWIWTRWGTISESIQYGYNAPAKSTGRIRMVRISDIHDNQVVWDTVPYCDIDETDIPTYLLKENDILFARTGGTVGKSFLMRNVICESIYAGYLIRTQYNDDLLVPQYLKYYMESELYWSQLRDGTIATAQPNCNGTTLSKMFIPLPPTEEQRRIVALVDELFFKIILL